ncbi:hypothetical protein GLYMA_16G040600v4 [Glycine max]|uniref:Uncharacterized protein n=1 Tax=Glycine max TaxID=3847 RepID=K7MF47_SOYBN|nr:hypothetical protein JHK85_044941 [Glycine max]KAH1149894.1 hypothetical protein GYH30_044083 [Glycine max]KHN46773.1 hypothetical protein glysoja_015024 [Glycine soja]KRH06699.1 hypothetical protein GLYMA_16G040600v4 [Glycine max]
MTKQMVDFCHFFYTHYLVFLLGKALENSDIQVVWYFIKETNPLYINDFVYFFLVYSCIELEQCMDNP